MAGPIGLLGEQLEYYRVRAAEYDGLSPPETSTALDHTLADRSATVLQRRLNDGRDERLGGLGWEFAIGQTAHYFLHGSGSRQVSSDRA